jgi:signal peptidase I
VTGVETAAHAPLRVPRQPDRRGSRRAGLTRLLCSLMLLGVVLLIVPVAAGMALGRWRFTVIDTGSMRPTLSPGDVAVLTPEPRAALRRGQIIAFHPPGEPRLTVVHRVFSIRPLAGGVVMQTKGDANNATDAWHARILSSTVWRERLKLPSLGYVSVWAGQRPVRLGLLIVVILAVTSLLSWIWRSTPAWDG